MGYRLAAFLASLVIHSAALCFLNFPSAAGSFPGEAKPAALTVFLAGASPPGISGEIREGGAGASPVEAPGLRVAPVKGQLHAAGSTSGSPDSANGGGRGGASGVHGGADNAAVPGPDTGDAAESGNSLEPSFTGNDNLRQLLYSLIEKRLSYPPAARRRGIQGKVDVVLQIGSEGQLLSSGVSHSSGSDVLDRAAGNVLAGIFPLKNMRMAGVEVLTVSIDYRLPYAPELSTP